MSSRIEKYEIAGLIGEGGFGRVFKAQDTQMKRWVAIKVMSVEQNETALQRFRNEAIVAGGLNHPNLVTVYELGEYNGRPYIVMEFLEGRDLSHFIGSEEELPLLKRIDVLVQAARGLERAHRQQVIHRDIKPANVMLLNDGSVKVMDFGIARLTHEVSRRNTATGMVVGSLLWMAPEIFSGQDADAQSDIWSFGVMAFEFLCGQHPFQPSERQAPSSTAQLIFQITQSEAPLLSSRNAEIPVALSEVVRRCMARDRNERYHSLRDVILDLEPVLNQQRRHQATVLAAQADAATTTGALDRAMDLVTQALEFDNESQPARQLRERLQREIKRKSSQDRVESLIQQASDDVAARRIDAAIAKLKSALELDPDSIAARSRLAELQVLLDRRKQVEQMASQASAKLVAGNLEDTSKLLEQAFSIEPNNSQLIQLQQSLVAERLRREKRQRFQEGLTQARDRLNQHRPDEALVILSRARDLITGEPGLDSLLFELEELRRESERMEIVRQALAKARILESKGDWDGVAAVLEPVAISSGADWPDVQSLLAIAQREAAAKRRAAEVQKALDEAKNLFKVGDLSGALLSVERSAVLYPEDKRFQALQQRLAEERKRREMDQASTRVQEEIRDLLNRQKYSEAMRRVDAAALEFPEADLREHRRRVAIDHARALQLAAKHDEAVVVLESAIARNGSDEILQRLKNEIEADRETSSRRNEILEAASRARRMLDTGELEAALDHVEQSLAAHPTEPVLLDLKARTSERLRTREIDRRNRDLEARLSQVETSIALHDWDRAASLLDTVEREYPGNPSAADLRAKLALSQRRHQLAMRKADIEAAIKLQDWDRAQQRLNEFRLDFAQERTAADELQRLIGSGMRESRLRAGIRALESAIEAKDWKSAEAQMAALRTEFPGEKAVREWETRWSQERTIGQSVERARSLIRDGDLTAAKSEIAKGLAVRRDAELEDLLAQIETGIQQAAPDSRMHATPAPPPDFGTGAYGRSGQHTAQRPAASPWKWIAGAGSLAVIAVIAFLALRPANKPAPLTASAPGRIETREGAALRQTLIAAGGSSPYRWTIDSGTLPDGVQLDGASGELSGTPSAQGTYRASAKVSDQTGASQVVGVEIVVEKGETKPPPLAKEAEPPKSPRSDTKKQEVATNRTKPVDPPPPPVKNTQTQPQQPVTEPERSSDVGVAEFARSGRPVWTGSLAPGAVLRIDGSNASAGRLVGLPVPGRIPVEVRVLSPAGVVVAKQPGADGGWRTFEVRNDSADAVNRIQLQWTRR